MGRPPSTAEPTVRGRYALFDVLARGGMATLFIGRHRGPAGFARTVAVKALHEHYAADADFVAMFLDETRIASRIVHPNIIATYDAIADEAGLMLVMEYIHGETLGGLLRAARARGERLATRVLGSIFVGVLHGLHAAHEARDEDGQPMGIVHRDVAPQNIIVGVDGVSRILDFGIAKAAGRLQSTRTGTVKGRASFLSPEQIAGDSVDRRADVYAVCVVLWEALTGLRLFEGESFAETAAQVLTATVDPPSMHRPELPAGLDAIVLKGLAADPSDRYATARDLAIALEKCLGSAPQHEVSELVVELGGVPLAERAARLAIIERERLDDVFARAAQVDVTARASLPSAAPPSGVVSVRGAGAFVLALGVLLAFVATRPGGAVAHGAAATAPAPATAPSAVETVEPEAGGAGGGATSAGGGTTSAGGARAGDPPPSASRPSRHAEAPCAHPFTRDARGVLHPRPKCL